MPANLRKAEKQSIASIVIIDLMTRLSFAYMIYRVRAQSRRRKRLRSVLSVFNRQIAVCFLLEIRKVIHVISRQKASIF